MSAPRCAQAKPLVLLWLARPPDHIRTTLYVTALAVAALFLVPNGMGSNISRLVFFCLPVAVVALSPLRSRMLALAVVPLAIAGFAGTALDLVNAQRPVSSAQYYQSLAHRLDTVPGLANCRLEVVDHGAQAGYSVLLGHAQLARGWETQENLELNKVLSDPDLDATTYKVWLDNNAVCYVALPADAVESNPEYDLVSSGSVPYLLPYWHNADWQLFRVADAGHIVPAPAPVLAFGQASMTLRVPCACTVNVRVRFSGFLSARLQTTTTEDGRTILAPVGPAVVATLADDGSGWTRLTTTRPGTYLLAGNLSDGILPR